MSARRDTPRTRGLTLGSVGLIVAVFQQQRWGEAMDQGSTQPVPASGGAGGTPTQGISRDMKSFREGFNFGDFVTFRYMITPPLITVIYVLAVIAITLGALAAISTSFIGALVFWILAMLWVRVVFEVMIVLFRINDGIQSLAGRR
jgi:Domain of unknown function (DUF4282)